METDPYISPEADATLPTGILTFESFPAAIEDISHIVPLGSLNPPQHTLPTDHIYFYINKGTTIFAPAAGKVYLIRSKTNGLVTDYRIDIRVTSGFAYYIDHIILDPVPNLGEPVIAGQSLGRSNPAYFAFDLGAINLNQQQPFANHWRYTGYSLYGDQPLKYYKEPLRSQLYALVNRSGPDKDGTFCYDLAGKLSGNWFLEGIPSNMEATNIENGTMEVAFAYSVSDPSLINISIGGTIFTNGVYFAQTGAPDPSAVSTAEGKVSYHLYNAPGGTRVGLLIAEMLSEERVKLEAFSDTVSDSRDFTAGAKIYFR